MRVRVRVRVRLLLELDATSADSTGITPSLMLARRFDFN